MANFLRGCTFALKGSHAPPAPNPLEKGALAIAVTYSRLVGNVTTQSVDDVELASKARTVDHGVASSQPKQRRWAAYPG